MEAMGTHAWQVLGGSPSAWSLESNTLPLPRQGNQADPSLSLLINLSDQPLCQESPAEGRACDPAPHPRTC